MSLTTVVSLVGAIGITAIATSVAWLASMTRAQSLLRIGFRARVDIVVSTRDESARERGPVTFDRWTTSLGTVKAVSLCSQRLTRMRRRVDTAVHFSIRTPTNVLDDVILLGGNSENIRSRDFIRALRLTHPELGFDYDDRDEARNVVTLDGRRCEFYWNDQAKQRDPTTDYGVIALWLNPSAPKARRAIFCAGFTSAGTCALIRYLFDGADGYLHSHYWHERWDARPPRRLSLRRILVRLPLGEWPCFVALYGLTHRGDDDVDVQLLSMRPIAGPHRGQLIRTPADLSYDRHDGGLTDDVAGEVAQLLDVEFSEAVNATDRTWTQLPPVYRFIARDKNIVVGQQAVVRLTGDGDRVLGLADLVVAPRYRNLGIARRLIENAVSEAWRRNAEIILTATSAPSVLRVLGDEGFMRAAPGQFFFLRDGQRQVNPAWHVAIFANGKRPDGVEIYSDF
jgi:GNAT superfamily N-acetyltransferase